MMDDSMHYNLLVSFHVQIAKWRVDDQTNRDKWEWSLSVFDRNKEVWVNINDLKRPGEFALIESVKLGKVQIIDGTSGQPKLPPEAPPTV